MIDIHPTAIISDGAVIGEDCRIGPYCVIGPNVTLGRGCTIQSHVVIDGYTSLGEGCSVFSFACLGKNSQDLKDHGEVAYVEIGRQCILREYVTVNASCTPGGKTIVGDQCFLLAYSHVAHDCSLGRKVIMSNGTSLAGHVTVGDDVVFGGLCGAHQFVRIGEGVMVGAMSKATQDILPFTLVNGIPAAPAGVNRIGLERRGHSPQAIRAVQAAYRVVFRSSLLLEEAIEKVRADFPAVDEVQRMVAFAEQSERGLARPRKTARQ